ncbi:hypothetical protein BN7_3706 [Wickerhamomyces ciferrii]|uniref:Flavin-containing monooxygenase n=1 Tax=Wickerhamomyces ciferrii (strain ATCC 14091 / BCRC 22168 / CBS 111 / JCM 3599 / NBRC 0793 / NRRL Y-1031 F-60-10) TaxID=1206466 RepID=K0KS18_WICCF|nr:uncharacterized protein BN7_3706 [Wickerhamomyces ciferrii]CCH44148.1 hypothetical protein BN7_3706 [Wickerhamomyces ciferrii]
MTVQDFINGVSAGKVKSVAIIGGGPSGAITLDALVREGGFEKIKVFERSSELGGVWSLSKNKEEGKYVVPVAPGSTIDQLDPQLDIPEIGDKKTHKSKRSEQIRFTESAGYKGLRTNVPEQLMCFSDVKDWGVDAKHRIEKNYVFIESVRQYIQNYYDRHPKDHIILRTSVENVSKDYANPNAKFVLTLRRETDEKDDVGNYLDEWYEEEFDAVVIATGHYHIPIIPKVPGLEKVFAKSPEKIIHSKYFKPRVHTFDNETVVVVGGRISGFDIATSLAKTSKTIYHSKKVIPEVKQRSDGFENIIEKPIIKKVEIHDNDKITVHFEDGTIVENVDRFIYGTGYHLSFPFMNKSYPGFTTGNILPDFYEHTFYAKDPLISLVGIPIQAITFRVFEYQAIWVARFLSGKIKLPSLEEQIKWILARYHALGNHQQYHSFADDKFEWPLKVIELAGGVKLGSGREFPIYTEEDKELHAQILKRFAEEQHFFLDPTKQYF